MKKHLILLWVMLTSNAYAETTFTPLVAPSIKELNTILTAERDNFSENPPKNYKMPHYSVAKNDIDIYKVSYDSIIPELNNKPIKATGLIAIPKHLTTSNLPIISYQHGTVFRKNEVPSNAFLDSTNPLSFETRLMVAQFASQGYIVIAADYFGMGDSKEPEAYTLKASEQQACLDLYLATLNFLKLEKNITPSNLFLTGWSQGGLVTTGFLEKLESLDIPVKAASTASSPNDLFAAMNGWIYKPRKIDASWLNTLVALTVFSYENYLSKPDLAKEVLKTAYYDDVKKIYDRNYKDETELQDILKRIPVKLKALLNDNYSNPSYFADSEYGKILNSMQTYRRTFKTPVQMYYGDLDQVIFVPIGKLAASYQESMGSKSIETVQVLAGNHHRTFLTAVAGQKKWFDTLIK